MRYTQLSIWYKRLRALLMIELALLMPAMPAIVGCSPPGTPTDGTPTDGGSTNDDFGDPGDALAFIQINNDPEDPMIAQLTGVENNDKLVLYGQKDASGSASQIDSMIYFENADDEDGFTFQLNSEGNPEFVTGPNGEVATLTYEGDTVGVTFTNADGSLSIETFDLSEQMQAKRARAELRDHYTQALSRTPSDNGTPTTIKAILGRVIINLVSNGVDAGTVKDAKLFLQASSIDGLLQPAIFNEGAGRYEFVVPHRVADLEVLITDCLSLSPAVADAMTFTGAVWGVFAVACIGVTGGWCGFILSPLGAIIGMSIGGTGAAATAANWSCASLRQDAIASGEGKQIVKITASHEALGFSEQREVTYDIFDPNDPITAAQEFTQVITVEVEAAIFGAFPTPGTPGPGQSYQVTFQFAPPGASIRYFVDGDDGFQFNELLSCASGDLCTTLTGSSIPGGAQGVIDEITPQVEVGGVIVKLASPIFVTFN